MIMMYQNESVRLLNKEEGIEKDIATFIDKAVFNKLKSTNVRECIRIARLAGNDIYCVQRTIDTFMKNKISI